MIGTSDGEQYEDSFKLAAGWTTSTMPSTAPEKPAGEFNSSEGTQVAMQKKETFIGGRRVGEGGGGYSPQPANANQDQKAFEDFTNRIRQSPEYQRILKQRGEPGSDWSLDKALRDLEGKSKPNLKVVPKEPGPQSMTDETPMGLGTTAMMNNDDMFPLSQPLRGGESPGGSLTNVAVGAYKKALEQPPEKTKLSMAKHQEYEDYEGSKITTWRLDDPSGKRKGTLMLSEADGGKTLKIENVWASKRPNEDDWGSPNDFGPTVVKDVLKQIKEHYPNAERLYGYRVSGARTKATQAVDPNAYIRLKPGVDKKPPKTKQERRQTEDELDAALRDLENDMEQQLFDEAVARIRDTNNLRQRPYFGEGSEERIRGMMDNLIRYGIR